MHQLSRECSLKPWLDNLLHPYKPADGTANDPAFSSTIWTTFCAAKYTTFWATNEFAEWSAIWTTFRAANEHAYTSTYLFSNYFHT